MQKYTPEQKQKLQRVIQMEMQLCGLHPMDFSDILLPHWMKLARPKFHVELFNLAQLKQLLVMAPRFFAKSVIFSRIYPLWAALTKKKSDYMIVSATEAIAVEQLRYLK